MTAQEARENTYKQSQDLIKKCDSLIMQSSMEGKFDCEFHLDANVSYTQRHSVVCYFRQNGFYVSVHNCYDDKYKRTNEKYLYIRWLD